MSAAVWTIDGGFGFGAVRQRDYTVSIVPMSRDGDKATRKCTLYLVSIQYWSWAPLTHLPSAFHARG